MAILWYDKQGKPFPGTELPSGSPGWERAMHLVEEKLADPDYKIIEQDYTPGKTFWVSTVWPGLDHDWIGTTNNTPNSHPVIFETMVFNGDKSGVDHGRDHEMQRYSTLAEAKAGHKKMLEEYKNLEKTFTE